MVFADKIVLVTGGTGSLGKILVKRLLSGQCGMPSRVIVLSRDEGKQYQMRLDYLHQTAATDEVMYNNFTQMLEFRIGDVTCYEDVCRALKDVDIVINAAAMKQVPTCEYFAWQAIKTNCQGAENIVRAIYEHNFPVETVVGVSTDKAVSPINVMGMTKALQERIFIAANILNIGTRFVCVRYGNVLASRGSVIPLFLQQIQQRVPVTITHPEMTRFFLSLDDAVDTIVEALARGQGGEVFIRHAPSVSIVNLAKAMIGDQKIDIEITNIRPGEKLHELLISEDESRRTVAQNGYFIVKPYLPELQQRDDYEHTLTAVVSSAESVLSLDETRCLLMQKQLLAKDQLVNQFQEVLV